MLKAVKTGGNKSVSLIDLEAEAGVISAALKGIFFDISRDDFADRSFADAYEFLRRVHASGEVLSLEALKRKVDLAPEKCALIKKEIDSSDAFAFASAVREKSALRKIIRAVKEIYDGKEVDPRIDLMLDAVRRYKDSKNTNTFVKASDLLKESLKDLEYGVLYGFDQLDTWTKGMHPGEFIVLAGRPSAGKTSLAVQIAANAAQSGVVAFFSLEMKAEQIIRKTACCLTGLRVQEIVEEDMHRAEEVVETTHLYVIDYLQLLKTRKKYDSRENEIAAISASLKAAAKELDVPVLALSQMRREIEKRSGKPKLSDLRGSGAIEQDADVVIFLNKENGSVEIILAKHRNGPTGVIPVEFYPEISTFYEV
ncbi:MAG: AAA family ATPase [Clostridia bacterium]|nr:AAA family ATPase [Clostridia bacterium]